MPTLPYPLTGETLEDLTLQTANLFQDIYENGIGGAAIGDAFTTESDVLTLRLHDEGGLKKVSSQLSIKLQTDSGLTLSSTGLAASVSQGNVNTSSGSVGGSDGNYTLPGGEYGFYPQTKGTAVISYICNAITLSSYTANISITGTSPYAQQRYVTSSGEIFWIFLLRDKSTGKIVGRYQAPDHPCFGHSGDPFLHPHPFLDYDTTKHDIIVINPSSEQVKQMKHICRSPQINIPPLDILELFDKHIEINEKDEREYPKAKVTTGVIKDEDMRPVWMKEKINILKIQIPQPEYIKVLTIKEIRDAGSPVSTECN